MSEQTLIEGVEPAEQPEPMGVAEPLPGWKLNHACPAPDDAGAWQIGFLDDEDDRFAPIATVDTGLYYQEEQAEPLARAILAQLIAAEDVQRLRAEVEALRAAMTEALPFTMTLGQQILLQALERDAAMKEPCAHVWRVTQQGATYHDRRCELCGAVERDSWD